VIKENIQYLIVLCDEHIKTIHEDKKHDDYEKVRALESLNRQRLKLVEELESPTLGLSKDEKAILEAMPPGGY